MNQTRDTVAWSLFLALLAGCPLAAGAQDQIAPAAPQAADQPGEEGRGSFWLDPCEDDIAKVCKGLEVFAARKCIMDPAIEGQLSEGCKAALAPRKRKAAVVDSLQAACKDDLAKACQGAKGAEAIKCLRDPANKAKLSAGCKREVSKLPPPPKKPCKHHPKPYPTTTTMPVTTTTAAPTTTTMPVTTTTAVTTTTQLSPGTTTTGAAPTTAAPVAPQGSVAPPTKPVVEISTGTLAHTGPNLWPAAFGLGCALSGILLALDFSYFASGILHSLIGFFCAHGLPFIALQAL